MRIVPAPAQQRRPSAGVKRTLLDTDEDRRTLTNAGSQIRTLSCPMLARCFVDVDWPDRRSDVLDALDLLASEPPSLDNEGQDLDSPT